MAYYGSWSDHFFTGISTAVTGINSDTATSQLLQAAGMSAQMSNILDSGLSMVGMLGASGAVSMGRLVSFPTFHLPVSSEILFGQSSTSAFFSKKGTFESKSISEVVQGLKNGTISPESLPIEIIVRNGQKITLNNRSLLALRRAGIEPKLLINRTGIKEYELFLDEHLRGNLPSDIIKIRRWATRYFSNRAIKIKI